MSIIEVIKITTTTVYYWAVMFVCLIKVEADNERSNSIS